MGLSIMLKNISGLPPAYSEVQGMVSLAKKLEEDTIRADLAWQIADKPGYKDLSPESSTRDFMLQEMPAQAHALFVKIFEQEVKVGNFEIFQTKGFFRFITSLEVSPLIIPVFAESEKVFLATLSELKYSLNHLETFIEMNRENWSASQVDALWETFKSALDLGIPDWVSSERITNKDCSIAVSDTKHHERLLTLGLQAFFGCLKASAKVIEEASALTSWEDCRLILVWRLHRNGDEFFENELGYDFPPVIIRDLHPEYFILKMRERGIDPKVIDMLTPSWKDDLDSLLLAAQSLSAEDATS